MKFKNTIGSNQHKSTPKEWTKRKNSLGIKNGTYSTVCVLSMAIGLVIGVCYMQKHPMKVYAKAVSPMAQYNDVRFDFSTPTPTPPTKKDIIYQYKHGDIIYQIWGLESSFGQQPFRECLQRSETNELGYNVLNHQCFKTFRESVATVEKWIEEHQYLTLGELLCTYNVGEANKPCEYEYNSLKINL